MLGKGLESLIPPNQGKRDDGQPAQKPVEPQKPPAALPEPPHEEALPSAPEPAAPLPMIRPEPQPVRPPVQPVQQTRPQQQPQPQPQPAKQARGNEERGDEKIFHLEIEKIAGNPDQPRRNFNQEALKELANSIREFGFLQPIVVSKVGKEMANGLDVEYQIIAGERRFMAAKILGLRSVPAIIRNVNLEREKLELAVIENIQRENLNPIETARAFERLQEEFRMTQREIAVKLGKSREVVANAMRLLDLPEYVRVGVEKGEISESNARYLLAIDDPGVQKRLFDEIVTNKLTTRDVKIRVEQMGGVRRGRPPLSEQHLPLEMKNAQDELAAALGAPVEIRKGAANGKIMITFYSEEELESILRRLGKERGF